MTNEEIDAKLDKYIADMDDRWRILDARLGGLRFGLAFAITQLSGGSEGLIGIIHSLRTLEDAAVRSGPPAMGREVRELRQLVEELPGLTSRGEPTQ